MTRLQTQLVLHIFCDYSLYSGSNEYLYNYRYQFCKGFILSLHMVQDAVLHIWRDICLYISRNIQFTELKFLI